MILIPLIHRYPLVHKKRVGKKTIKINTVATVCTLLDESRHVLSAGVSFQAQEDHLNRPLGRNFAIARAVDAIIAPNVPPDLRINPKFNESAKMLRKIHHIYAFKDSKSVQAPSARQLKISKLLKREEPTKLRLNVLDNGRWYLQPRAIELPAGEPAVASSVTA